MVCTPPHVLVYDLLSDAVNKGAKFRMENGEGSSPSHTARPAFLMTFR